MHTSGVRYIHFLLSQAVLPFFSPWTYAIMDDVRLRRPTGDQVAYRG